MSSRSHRLWAYCWRQSATRRSLRRRSATLWRSWRPASRTRTRPPCSPPTSRTSSVPYSMRCACHFLVDLSPIAPFSPFWHALSNSNLSAVPVHLLLSDACPVRLLLSDACLVQLHTSGNSTLCLVTSYTCLFAHFSKKCSVGACRPSGRGSRRRWRGCRRRRLRPSTTRCGRRRPTRCRWWRSSSPSCSASSAPPSRPPPTPPMSASARASSRCTFNGSFSFGDLSHMGACLSAHQWQALPWSTGARSAARLNMVIASSVSSQCMADRKPEKNIISHTAQWHGKCNW